MSADVKIICGDSAVELGNLEAGSVQLCVTSPPYDKLRTAYGCVFDFETIAKEIYRVLCDGGVLCWNVNDEVVDGSETLTSFRQAIYFKDSVGFFVHDTMIYKKFGFSHPETVRYHSTFEYVFILSKGPPATFNPIKDRRNVTAGQSAWGTSTFIRSDGSRHLRRTQGTISADFGMRHNVWEGKTRGQEEPCKKQTHSAKMPKWLARDLIRSWSDPGDIVLDPFAGSGTTGAAAIEWGRKAILIEKEPSYIPLISESISKVQPMQIT